MVYTTLSYTVVYNLFFIAVCVSFCLPVGVFCFWYVSSLDGSVVPLGVRGEIRAASLSCVEKKGVQAENVDVTMWHSLHLCFWSDLEVILSEWQLPRRTLPRCWYVRGRIGGKSRGTENHKQ